MQSRCSTVTPIVNPLTTPFIWRLKRMKRFLAALASVAIGIIVVAAVGLFAAQRGTEPALMAATVDGTVQTPNGEVPHAKLSLDIYPQSSAAIPGPTGGQNDQYVNLGWPFYWPSTTLQVPAHSMVTVTIHQYDSGGAIYNAYLANVHGTVDGTMKVDGNTVKGIPPTQVAHTFTIHQYPETTQPYLFVSVPLPMNAADAPLEANGYPKPHEVTFSFMTGAPGDYVWNCEFPCGSGYLEFGGPMSQRGWMSGKLKVV